MKLKGTEEGTSAPPLSQPHLQHPLNPSSGFGNSWFGSQRAASSRQFPRNEEGHTSALLSAVKPAKRWRVHTEELVWDRFGIGDLDDPKIPSGLYEAMSSGPTILQTNHGRFSTSMFAGGARASIPKPET